MEIVKLPTQEDRSKTAVDSLLATITKNNDGRSGFVTVHVRDGVVTSVISAPSLSKWSQVGVLTAGVHHLLEGNESQQVS